MKQFRFALATLPRHRAVSEIVPLLSRLKSSGFTGIWLENNELQSLPEARQTNPGFSDNHNLFNIFDLTLGHNRDVYLQYLKEIGDALRAEQLQLCLSFWMPQLNAEFLGWLQQNRPSAIGVSNDHEGKPTPTLCTCQDGQGLAVLTEMIQILYCAVPDIWGLKVATEDNNALLCDPSCPNAHGMPRRQHAGNLFSTVQRAMLKANPQSRFLLYPWFWSEGYEDEILSRLADGYLIVTKFESGAIQQLETAIPGDPLFDSSIVAEKPGPLFSKWLSRVGPERLIDMVPLGTGIDDFFLANPPYPGRLFRRLMTLRKSGVISFLDFECGGYSLGTAQDIVRILDGAESPTEEQTLSQLAAERSHSAEFQSHTLHGWRSFDRGFGLLPIGLSDPEQLQFSGRFGFAWSMCIATPLLPQFIGQDRHHEIHWFSPYNFFTPKSSTRLAFHFSRVLADWQQSSLDLAIAAALAPESQLASRDAVSARAHVLSVLSVLNWAAAAQMKSADPRLFPDLMAAEIHLTEKFADLVARHPWIWANHCWHPHRTPLSQRFAGVPRANSPDAFAAKIEIMQRELARKTF